MTKTRVALACLALLAVTALVLHAMGRPWICACGHVALWHGDPTSSENSQHLTDWYTFTHVIHGFLFYAAAWAIGRILLHLHPPLEGEGRRRSRRGGVEPARRSVDVVETDTARHPTPDLRSDPPPPGEGKGSVLGARRGWLLPAGIGFVLAMVVECAWEIVENTPWVVARYRAETVSLGYSGDSVVNSLADIAATAFGYGLAATLPVAVIVAAALAIEVALALLIRDNLTLNVLMLLHPLESVKAWQAGTKS